MCVCCVLCVMGGHTSIQGWETIEGCIILLNSLLEIVGRETVLPHLVVDTPEVVEVKRSETFTGICGHGHVRGGAQDLHSLLEVTAQVFHIGLEEVGTGCLVVIHVG